MFLFNLSLKCERTKSLPQISVQTYKCESGSVSCILLKIAQNQKKELNLYSKSYNNVYLD